MIVTLLYFRYWNPIPSNGRNHDHLQHTRVQLPDGTYLAPEFNYSLPRQRKGYDTIGYKYRTQAGGKQSGHDGMTTFRPDRERDRGYYSDHTYESPACEHGGVTGRGNFGYHAVIPKEIETDTDPTQNIDVDKK